MLTMPVGLYAKITQISNEFYFDFSAIEVILDSNFKSNVAVVLINHIKKDVLIKRGDKIAQIVFYQNIVPECFEIMTHN